MSPADARQLLLAAEIERDWTEVARHVARASSADPADGEHAAAFVALSIDHAYQAFETLLIRVERALSLPTRLGGSWHRAVLEDAALDIRGLRPPLVGADVLPDWAEVMAFRHFLRHAYSTSLDPRRLSESRAALERAAAATAPRVRAFSSALGA